MPPLEVLRAAMPRIPVDTGVGRYAIMNAKGQALGASRRVRKFETHPDGAKQADGVLLLDGDRVAEEAGSARVDVG